MTLLRALHLSAKTDSAYRRDLTFHEDAGRTLDWTVAEALAIINNLVLALLLRGGHTKVPNRRRYYAAHPDEALKRLLAAPS